MFDCYGIYRVFLDNGTRFVREVTANSVKEATVIATLEYGRRMGAVVVLVRFDRPLPVR
jgi:hypothetical protein